MEDLQLRNNNMSRGTELMLYKTLVMQLYGVSDRTEKLLYKYLQRIRRFCDWMNALIYLLSLNTLVSISKKQHNVLCVKLEPAHTSTR